VPLGKGDCHMPIGMGTAPVKDIINCIKNDYKGRFVFEYRSIYRDFLKESAGDMNAILNGIMT